MDSKEGIFYRFLNANSISSKPDFPRGRIIYHGLDKPRTRIEIEESLEFQGFSDGIGGVRNRYVVEREKKQIASLGGIRSGSFGSVYPDPVRNTPTIDEAVAIIAKTPLEYLDQYRLGSSLIDRSPGEIF